VVAVEMLSMTTSPVQAAAPARQLQSKGMSLQTEDFIKMMITQLQNQDPLEPAKNQELLAQMSQIGQLQSQTLLQESIQGMVLQQSLGAAGNLIGKMVQGIDERGEQTTGLVSAVRVEKNEVFLELDSGKRLSLAKVTGISAPPANQA
jgi:flagellar basal-body rod modification protein FlgD